MGLGQKRFSCDFCKERVLYPTLYLDGGIPCYFCDPGCLKGYAKRRKKTGSLRFWETSPYKPMELKDVPF